MVERREIPTGWAYQGGESNEVAFVGEERLQLGRSTSILRRFGLG